MEEPCVTLEQISTWSSVKHIQDRLRSSGFNASNLYFSELDKILSYNLYDEDVALYREEWAKELISNTRRLGYRGAYIEKSVFYRSEYIDQLQLRNGFDVWPCLSIDHFEKWRIRQPHDNMRNFLNEIEDYKDEEFYKHFQTKIEWNNKKSEAHSFFDWLVLECGYEKSKVKSLKYDAHKKWYFIESPKYKIKFSVCMDTDLGKVLYDNIPLNFWLTTQDGRCGPDGGSLKLGSIIPNLIPYFGTGRIKAYLLDPNGDNSRSFMLGMKAVLVGFKYLAETF